VGKIDLLRTLVRRDLEARYKGSILGNCAPIKSIVTVTNLHLRIFIVLNVKLTLKGYLQITDFGLWLFAGLLPWIAFTGGLFKRQCQYLLNRI
jgi:lipopolysaccharide transport system permease protein